MYRTENNLQQLKVEECRRMPQTDIRLKQGAVYALPNGSELVVGIGGRGGHYFLYLPLVWAGQGWVISMPVAYEVDGGGSVLTDEGRATGWCVEDLTDLHRTVERKS